MFKGKKKNSLQSQLRRLLFVLVLITGLNALFFWKTLDQLFSSYQSVARSQKIATLAGDLERFFFEESKLRNSEVDSANYEKLSETRKQIKATFRQLRELVSDKGRTRIISNLQNEWTAARDDSSTMQLLILVRSFIRGEQVVLAPLETGAQQATKASILFLAAYVAVFAVAVTTLSQYLRRRVFMPLGRLSENMKHFQAGTYQLPDQSYSDDEIGYLESQFHNMGRRIGQTVNELKEVDRVKTDFISIASHELRTPMTAVKGSLSLILSGNLEEIGKDVRELLIISQNETDRLIRLINDILDLTKIDARQLHLERKWNSLTEVINTVVQSLKGLYEVTKVTVKVIPPKVSCQVRIDRDRIMQVLTNLLSNAVKFSPAGSTVDVSYEIDAEGTFVVVYVADRGPGIKPEDQVHVFEKFRSRDLGKSKIMRGTGLGLPICKALVEQHGGDIGLDSKVGVGSTFHFSLPEIKIVNESLGDVA